MKTRKILWVTPKWPLPACDGARQATCSALRALSNLGEHIDLLSFVDNPIEEKEENLIRQQLGVKNIFIALKYKSLGRFSRTLNLIHSTISRFSLPFTVIPYKVKNLGEVLNLESNNNCWSHIVFDGLHPAASFQLKNQANFIKNARIIYRAHNIEANLWKQTANKSSWPARLLLRIQERKVSRFEAELIANSAAIATVSAKDLAWFNSSYRLPLSKVIPIGYNFTPTPKHNNQVNQTSDIKLLFVGSTSWRPNREGLTWFLREVWPSVTAGRSNISITIAGRGTEKLKLTFSNLTKIEFLGEIQSLDTVYENSHAAIVPIFSGSGTRVKAIEASRFECACISTEIGVEGLPLIPGDSYLRAESKNEWIKILTEVKLEDLLKVGATAHQALKKDFDAMVVGKAMVELLDCI